MDKKIINRKEDLWKQEQDFFRSVAGQVAESERRITQKREELNDVKQCGARLTKHRFTY